MDKIITCCRERGLRITVGLKTILQALEEAKLPQSLHDLELDPNISEVCDRTTIFRILQRLENIGLLRRLNFAHSGAKFSLNTGSKHQEYLICRECGDVQALDMHCPVHAIEEQLAEQSGFAQLSHELTFYGLCSSCAKQAA